LDSRLPDRRALVAAWLPIVAGVALPIGLAAVLDGLSPRLAKGLRVLLRMFCFVYLPLYRMARALIRWAVLEEPLLRALTRDVYVDWLPRPGAGLAGWPCLTLGLVALNVLGPSRWKRL
jgi:hypothetical protein